MNKCIDSLLRIYYCCVVAMLKLETILASVTPVLTMALVSIKEWSFYACVILDTLASAANSVRVIQILTDVEVISIRKFTDPYGICKYITCRKLYVGRAD